MKELISINVETIITCLLLSVLVVKELGVHIRQLSLVQRICLDRTGHNSEIVTDKKGNDWIFYHAFEANNAKKGRVLMMDRIIWEDGWPKVEGSVPALQAIAPSF